MVDMISRGSAQITILDLTDGRKIVSYIGSDRLRQVIYNPDTSSYNPDYSVTPITLTPNLKLAGTTEDKASQATSIKWFYQINSIGPMVEITDSNATYTLGSPFKTLRINTNILASNLSVRYFCELTYFETTSQDDIFALSEIELVKITNGTSGKNPVLGVITNDSQIIQAKTDGTGGIYLGASSEMIIYDGTVDVTANWSITPLATEGIVGTFLNNVYTVTSMDTDTGSVTFTGTRSGFPNIVKVFTITKVKNGMDAVVTKLNLSSQVIKKTESGTYIPLFLPVSSVTKIGDGDYTPYVGRFRIYESDGDSYSLIYTSSIDESSYNFYPSENISDIKIQLYTNDLATMLDEEIIPVVLDGLDSITPVIDCPNGMVIRNGEQTLTAVLTVYKGGSTITPSVYNWYKIVPDTLGDELSGPGWVKLTLSNPENTTGFTSNTLTIPPSAVNGSETFMAIVTYNNRILKSTITVSDLNDPYSVITIGNNLFKNGKGTNTYTTKVYHLGVEIDLDINNPLYTYEWDLYDSDGLQIPSFIKSGKTITVDASEILNSGTLVCTVKD